MNTEPVTTIWPRSEPDSFMTNWRQARDSGSATCTATICCSFWTVLARWVTISLSTVISRRGRWSWSPVQPSFRVRWTRISSCSTCRSKHPWTDATNCFYRVSNLAIFRCNMILDPCRYVIRWTLLPSSCPIACGTVSIARIFTNWNIKSSSSISGDFIPRMRSSNFSIRLLASHLTFESSSSTITARSERCMNW